MPAKSKSQQRFMGMVHALQKGELSPSDVSDKVKDAADQMDDKDAEDYASTKHKSKPEHVPKEVIRKVRETIRQIVKENPAAAAAASDALAWSFAARLTVSSRSINKLFWRCRTSRISQVLHLSHLVL